MKKDNKEDNTTDHKSSRRLAQDWTVPRHNTFVKELRESSKKWFFDKGLASHPKMGYILEKYEDWKNNIILKEVSEYIQKHKADRKQQSKAFPLHKYIHHGLSSQAMIFNLVGPLITRNDLGPLYEVFRRNGIDIKHNIGTAEFEYEDRTIFNEDTGQPTSIDLVLMDQDGNPLVFIESKLVEAEFGGCSVFASGDCNGKNPITNLDNCFLHFIGRKYWEVMGKHGFLEIIRNEKTCILINFYQFFREVLLSIEKNGIFTLLYDNRSTVFNYRQGIGLMPFLIELVPGQHKNKVTMISIQELVVEIISTGRHNDWISEFKEKYGIL
jgi:hypothetical protein